jgi:hypothetical protein
MSALRTADELPEDSPLARLTTLMDRYISKDQRAAGSRDEPFTAATINGLWEVIRSEELYRDSVFETMELDDPTAQSMRNYVVVSGRRPEEGDHLWLNRMIVASALRQVIGKPCLQTSRKRFDGILVSDAGGKFKISRESQGGGLIGTALRSSDILMDRVWQLESEVFEHTSGVVFVPIFAVVDRSLDPNALDPAIQRQVSRIRTDMDRFSDLEISSLVQHGYGVARQICRRKIEMVDGEVPDGPPWNPLDKSKGQSQASVFNRTDFMDARRLRDSSKRKIVSTLLSLHDWPSYFWLVLVSMLAIGVPYLIRERSERLRQQETILSAVAQLNPNYDRIVELLRHEEMPEISPMPYETASALDKPDLTGFEVLADSRIFDLRDWTDSNPHAKAFAYSRTQVRRVAEVEHNIRIRLQQDSHAKDLLIECRPASLNPQLSRMDLGNRLYRWELEFDFSHVPLNSHADIETRRLLPSGLASVCADEGRFLFTVRTKTGLLEVWLLMPSGRSYVNFEVSSHPIDRPDLSEVVVPSAVVRVAIDSVATFRLINPEPNRRYECRWKWSDRAGTR